MITTVVFDMDDTLYPEIDYCKSAFNAVARFLADSPDFATSHPHQAIFDALWAQFNSGNHKTTFNAALDQLKISYTNPDILQLVQIYRQHTPNITLPENSKKILDITTAKYTLAMLTDGFMPAQRLKAEALGIVKYFKYIVYTEQIGRQFWKPHTKGFEMILSELQKKPENCVYIADNLKKDFIAPNKLGFTTIQLSTQNRIHTANENIPKNALPHHKIDDILQFPPLLSRI